MVSAQRLADLGYKAVSFSLMAVTVGASVMLSVRVYHVFQHRKAQQQAGDSPGPARD
ncbi:PREDICTED: cytochrome c oxidase assembly protein COX14 [Gavialis gangeticus]|uniref:cytochrome c oxidase assembly protein COX14 n=1 Tax=Gavialis gangeticus TaxID=94835 RepID=UPI00092EC249|nr:PREDICTED: cytochrome c oxidase assembly protein COX14 [Gavialis gangeticus]